MQIKIDIKSLVVGLVLGAVVFLVMGQMYEGAGKSDFGITVDRSGLAIVRDNNNILYVIEPQREKATIIEYDNGPYKGRYVDLDLDVTTRERP
jgi:hypothetical protein